MKIDGISIINIFVIIDQSEWFSFIVLMEGILRREYRIHF